MGPVFNASYPGECSECGMDFEEGDPIRYDDDDEIICEDCGEEQAQQYNNWVPQPRSSS